MKRAVLLDDDPIVLNVVSRQLSRLGLDVVTCRDLEGAEALIKTLPIDVVVADLCVSDFGDLEGGRLLARLARVFPDTRLVAISATVDARVRDFCRRLGCPTVLEKPVRADLLAEALLGVLGTPTTDAAGTIQDLEPLEAFLDGCVLRSEVQPIVRLEAGGPPWRMQGVECLVRAPGPTPYANPEILFEYANRKERGAETDLLCIDAALREVARLPQPGRIFLNLQPPSLSRAGFAEGVEERVRGAGFAVSDVVLELTEHEAILDARRFATALDGLRSRGFRVALDDYGVGYSNLRLVLDLAPDYLKISGFLCRGLPSDERKRTIVGHTAEMAGRLGIVTILEGVETDREHDAARALGVDFAQGYYYARPASADTLRESRDFRPAVPRRRAALKGAP